MGLFCCLTYLAGFEHLGAPLDIHMLPLDSDQRIDMILIVLHHAWHFSYLGFLIRSVICIFQLPVLKIKTISRFGFNDSLLHLLVTYVIDYCTYVLDVHPFNPRIAMSAGYDGKTIVWDIWEGTPIRIYETGRFKLVDGKFSPDGMSIILSDDVGQLYILNTGQGESQKDAKYDQFFLGDYRPLIHDTHGNVLDQETQLAPHRRNIQDLLCDSGMIPYPEPYQSMFQKRRLGALGIEWRPSSVKFAVGADISLGQDYQMLPLADLDRMEPFPEFIDAMDWEPEIEVQSDDTDSEYNVPEEYFTEGEQGNLSTTSSTDPEGSAEDSEVEHSQKDALRRSKRKKHKAEVEIMTSSGRRVKRRNLDERDGTLSRSNRTKKSSNGRRASRRKFSKSKSLRPQRVAARNALNLFSQITGTSTDGEDEDGSEDDLSDSESMLQNSNIQSNESDRSLQNVQQTHPRGKEVSLDESEDVVKPPEFPESQPNAGNRRRLILKLPIRDSKRRVLPENSGLKCNNQVDLVGSSSKAPQEITEVKKTPLSSEDPGSSSGDAIDLMLHQNCSGIKMREREQSEKVESHLDLSTGYKDKKIRWGEVKARTSKRLRLGDAMLTDAFHGSNASLDGHGRIRNNVNGHVRPGNEYGTQSPHSEKAHKNKEQLGDGMSEGCDGAGNKEFDPPEHAHKPSLLEPSPQDDHQQMRGASPVTCNGNLNKGYKERSGSNECRDYDETLEVVDVVADDNTPSSVFNYENGTDHHDLRENPPPTSTKFKIRSKRILRDPGSPSKIKFISEVENWRNPGYEILSESPSQMEKNIISGVPEEDEGTSRPSPDHGDSNGLGKLEAQIDMSYRPSALQDSQMLHSHSNNKMYNAVYKRSKSYRARTNSGGGMEESTSNASNHNLDARKDFPEAATDGGRRTRSMGMKTTTCEPNSMSGNIKVREDYGGETSKSAEKLPMNAREQLLSEEWRPISKMTVGLRSARNRRGGYYDSNISPLDKRKTHHSMRKLSWLMLLEHEESYRYIPQQGDEVVYLRQGHQEYIEWTYSPEVGPWRSLKGNLRDVEFCIVEGLDYSTLPGSGESCCKITLQFVDPSSSVFSKTFKLTLPELIDFSDFLVERTRYDAATMRNWTHRDKCQVWWRSENEEGGSWWEGRILAVKPKSPEFPDSPWERYVIQYKSDPTGTHLHSPWELHDPDARWEHPHIDDANRSKLLSSFSKLEHSGNRNQDNYGIRKLKQVAQKSDFLNRFPVPLSVEVIQSRLEHNYYRSLEAFKHDITVMLSNAQSYFGKNVELVTKIRHLSDWFARMLSTLSAPTETVL
ncbi:hypothetical protein HHK36_023003 [Tetracentron sinense]|uniref:Bromo domain-containing protein n=1 Tax=Tetracentron sinense TaxID=13715 RepID=A0A834YNS7_TETSI|nr:hypothetical protein HHK36_023003 [Tetracentron sinense]